MLKKNHMKVERVDLELDNGHIIHDLILIAPQRHHLVVINTQEDMKIVRSRVVLIIIFLFLSYISENPLPNI